MADKYGPFYFNAKVPSGTYGLAAEVSVSGVANLLVVSESMPEPLAHDITKLLFDKQRDLEAIHPQARELSLETALKGSPIPYHSGAIRYYRERSVWKE